MAIRDGQRVNAAETNPAFISALEDDQTIGKVALKNDKPESGPHVENAQAAINSNLIATGANEFDPAVGVTYDNAEAVIANGASHKDALKALAAKFVSATGHKHTGLPGDAPKVSAADIANVPLKGFVIKGADLAGISGASYDVSGSLSADVPSNGQTEQGVVVNSPYNRTVLRQATGVNAGDAFTDGFGNEVYGRLTYTPESTATDPTTGVVTTTPAKWLLSFFIDSAGTETSYSFTTATDLRWYYQKIYNPLVNSPVYSEFAQIPSDNATADVVPATTTQQGKVSLATGSTPVSTATHAGTPNGRVANEDHTHKGVHSVAVNGSPQLFGDVKLLQGENIILTQTEFGITVAALGAIGTQETLPGLVNGANATFGPLSQTPTNGQSIIVFVDSLAVPKTNWNLVGQSIVFNAGSEPQPGQHVYAFYLTAGNPTPPPAPQGQEQLEYRTLSSTEIAQGYVVLAATPAAPAKVMLDLIGGSAQVFNEDFTVAGNQLQWSGLGLSGLLETGDKLRVHYFS